MLIYNSRNLINVLDPPMNRPLCFIYNSRNLINVLDPYIVLLHKFDGFEPLCFCCNYPVFGSQILGFASILKIKTEVCKRFGWDGRIRTDEYQSQSLVPYRLATSLYFETHIIIARHAHNVKSKSVFDTRKGAFFSPFSERSGCRSSK